MKQDQLFPISCHIPQGKRKATAEARVAGRRGIPDQHNPIALWAIKPSVRPIASSAIVRSPLDAASATFALNAALCFFRVRFMSCSCAHRRFLGQGPP